MKIKRNNMFNLFKKKENRRVGPPKVPYVSATDIARVQLIRHEGFRSKPYRDTVGKLTIGYGTNLQD
jgi:hypothetical protein